MHWNYVTCRARLEHQPAMSPYGSFAYGAKGVSYSISQGVYEQDLSHYQQQE